MKIERDFKKELELEIKQKVSEVPIETKQKVLDLLKKDGLNIGQVKEKLNLELLVVTGIITENIGTVEYLRSEAL